MSAQPRQVQLRNRPTGQIKASDFSVVDAALPKPDAGQLLVRNEMMSVDPYMRLGLGNQEGFNSAMQPGDIMSGAAIGMVEQSTDPAFPIGCRVLSANGWRTHFAAPAADLKRVDTETPGQWYLGFLGLTGITAFLGIERVLQPTGGETIFVSGAAGAVGSVACQLAKLRGARVLGSASSDKKAQWLRDEIGVDAVFKYKNETLESFMGREAPDGVDCFFDNVGGEMLDSMLNFMKPYGRVGACGAISQYEIGDYRSGPANFFTIVEKSLIVRGFNAFLLSDDENTQAIDWLRARAASGQIQPFETIIDGLENMPDAFAGLFQGGYLGKLIIKV